MRVSAASLSDGTVAAPEIGTGPPRAVVTELARAHYAFAWRVLRRLGLTPSDADDAAQQVFLVIARRASDIEPGKERAFLFRTATHVAAKVRRSQRRRHEDTDAEVGERIDERSLPDELLEQRRARALLDTLLDALPVELSAVIVLHEIEGLTMSEIAHALEVPAGTVASRLRRAREALTLAFARCQRPHPPQGARS